MSDATTDISITEADELPASTPIDLNIAPVGNSQDDFFDRPIRVLQIPNLTSLTAS